MLSYDFTSSFQLIKQCVSSFHSPFYLRVVGDSPDSWWKGECLLFILCVCVLCPALFPRTIIQSHLCDPAGCLSAVYPLPRVSVHTVYWPAVVRENTLLRCSFIDRHQDILLYLPPELTRPNRAILNILVHATGNVTVLSQLPE